MASWQGLLEQVRERMQALAGEEIRKVILFGSRARGGAGADSDYDVLVVLGSKYVDKRQWRKRLYQCLRGLGGMVEPWVMSEEEFEETKNIVGSLAYPACHEGIVLYEKS